MGSKNYSGRGPQTARTKPDPQTPFLGLRLGGLLQPPLQRDPLAEVQARGSWLYLPFLEAVSVC